jgi:MOSC domain-containing protein YiiM
MPDHRPLHELQGWLEQIRGAPSTEGRVELMVRRPEVEAREVITQGELCATNGLVGDNWTTKPTRATGLPDPKAQLTLMNARAAAAIAGERDRWPLAGDQLFVDFDISAENVPPGTRLAVGAAEIEVTDQPHLGCGKFVRRFGIDAQKFVNSPDGRTLNCRGINTRVIVPGTVHTGDTIRKLA